MRENPRVSVLQRPYTGIKACRYPRTWPLKTENLDLTLTWPRRAVCVSQAEDPSETYTWVQHLRQQTHNLGQWRRRRNALPNIMLKNVWTTEGRMPFWRISVSFTYRSWARAASFGAELSHWRGRLCLHGRLARLCRKCRHFGSFPFQLGKSTKICLISPRTAWRFCCRCFPVGSFTAGVCLLGTFPAVVCLISLIDGVFWPQGAVRGTDQHVV